MKRVENVITGLKVKIKKLEAQQQRINKEIAAVKITLEIFEEVQADGGEAVNQAGTVDPQ